MKKSIVGFCLFCLCTSGAAQDWKIEDLVGEYWYGLYLNGQKAGYSMSRVDVSEEGIVTATEDAQFHISMAGTRQRMRISTTRVYGADGNLAHIESFVDDGAAPKRFEGRVEGDHMMFTTVLGGQSLEKTLPRPRESLNDMAKQLQLLEQGQVGAEVSFSLFEPMYEKEIEGVSRIAAIEMRIFEGAPTKVYKITTTLALMGIESVAYVTEDGTTLEDVVAGIITMRLEPEEMAKDVDYSNDVIISNAAYVNKPIRNARLRDSLTLELQGPLDESHLFNDDRQHFVAQNGHFIFTSNAIDLTGLKPSSIPISDAALEQWLQPTLYVQSDHPDMVAQAEEIIGDERDAIEVTEKLCRWVYRTVRTTFSARLTNALEVLKEREGDCTEHSILFIGLARAVGLPAREVAGLIYVSTPEPGFYFHQWAKVWVGKWIDVDPTFNQVLADVTHIKLSEGDLFEQAKLIPVIGKIKVKVLE